VTFHSFRRTYATLQRFLEPPAYVARQLGHVDSRFTYRVYMQTDVRRRDRLAPTERAEFDRALDWSRIGPVETAGIGRSGAAAEAAFADPRTENPA
jgi:hypothetical protein